MGDLTILVGPTLRKLEAAKAELDRRIAAVRLALGGVVTPGPQASRGTSPARAGVSCRMQTYGAKRRVYRRRKSA
jgi:hypothetical protein